MLVQIKRLLRKRMRFKSKGRSLEQSCCWERLQVIHRQYDIDTTASRVWLGEYTYSENDWTMTFKKYVLIGSRGDWTDLELWWAGCIWQRRHSPFLPRYVWTVVWALEPWTMDFAFYLLTPTYRTCTVESALTDSWMDKTLSNRPQYELPQCKQSVSACKALGKY